MSYLSDLRTRRNAIAAELAALTATAAGGKPNMGGIAGGAVDHVGYKDGLYRELKEIDDLLQHTSVVDAQENGPWELES